MTRTVIFAISTSFAFTCKYVNGIVQDSLTEERQLHLQLTFCCQRRKQESSRCQVDLALEWGYITQTHPHYKLISPSAKIIHIYFLPACFPVNCNAHFN